VLLSISGGSDLGLFEINEAASLVSDAAHPDANIIFGAVIDDALGDEVRVTVIAAGFDGGRPNTRRDAGTSVVGGAAPVAPVVPGLQRSVGAASVGARTVAPAPVTPAPVAPAPVAPVSATNGTPSNGSASSRPAASGGGLTVPPLPPVPGPVGSGRRPLSSEDFEEELDIPEFLRST